MGWACAVEGPTAIPVWHWWIWGTKRKWDVSTLFFFLTQPKLWKYKCLCQGFLKIFRPIFPPKPFQTIQEMILILSCFVAMVVRRNFDVWMFTAVYKNVMNHCIYFCFLEYKDLTQPISYQNILLLTCSAETNSLSYYESYFPY